MERAKPPYPSPPSYKSHPAYSRQQPGSCTSSPDSGHAPRHAPAHYLHFHDWDSLALASMARTQHRPDLSSDSDYFSTSTYRDHYKGRSPLSSLCPVLGHAAPHLVSSRCLTDM